MAPRKAARRAPTTARKAARKTVGRRAAGAKASSRAKAGAKPAKRTAKAPSRAKTRAKATTRRTNRAPKSARAVPRKRAASTTPTRRTGPTGSARPQPLKKAAPKKNKKKTKRPVATAPTPTVPQRKSPAPRAPRAALHHADLERPRRRLAEIEAEEPAGPDNRLLSSARTGADELRQMLEAHTEASPALTAGDVDAKWDDAYAVGDEAPGGDNPTPGQDRVDDIGKALGVSYEDNEELIGSEKIIERDRHRWELDPASSDDWPHNKDE